MRLNKRIVMIAASVLFLASLSACGPSWSTHNIRGAKSALAEAEKANAAELAPYEYTMAVEYLKKAEELWGHSKFGDSKDYAAYSEKMAKSATEKANKDPWKNPLANQVIDVGSK